MLHNVRAVHVCLTAAIPVLQRLRVPWPSDDAQAESASCHYFRTATVCSLDMRKKLQDEIFAICSAAAVSDEGGWRSFVIVATACLKLIAAWDTLRTSEKGIWIDVTHSTRKGRPDMTQDLLAQQAAMHVAETTGEAGERG